MNNKLDHIKCALALADLLKAEKNEVAKKIFAKAILSNLKAYLKQDK